MMDLEKRQRFQALRAELHDLNAEAAAERKERRRAQRKTSAAARKLNPMKGQREPRVRNNPYLAFLRRQPCLYCGTTPSDAAHVRWAPTGSGWRYVGKGEKPDDVRAVPLCRTCHEWQHSMSESYFWDAHLERDPVKTCADLYAAFMAQSPKASQTRPDDASEDGSCRRTTQNPHPQGSHDA